MLKEKKIKICFIGNPNVGKSTLINRLLNSNELQISKNPGTTKTIIEKNLIRNEKEFIFLDTAGVYKKKDFNQALGCMIILIGALLVPWTYGISLLLLSILDYFLYRRIKDSVECYKCKTEYKNIDVPTSLQPFDHHVAELYEKYDA